MTNDEIEALETRLYRIGADTQFPQAGDSAACFDAAQALIDLRAEVARLTRERDEALNAWEPLCKQRNAAHRQVEMLREALMDARGYFPQTEHVIGDRIDIALAETEKKDG